jgi:hypothetical protein
MSECGFSIIELTGSSNIMIMLSLKSYLTNTIIIMLLSYFIIKLQRHLTLQSIGDTQNNYNIQTI